jgi:hypothetical protein
MNRRPRAARSAGFLKPKKAAMFWSEGLSLTCGRLAPAGRQARNPSSLAASPFRGDFGESCKGSE